MAKGLADGDLPGRDALVPRQGHLEYAVFVAGLDLLGVEQLRQRDGAAEVAAPRLAAVLAGPLGYREGALAGHGQLLTLGGDLERLLVHARQLGPDEKPGAVVVDVQRGEDPGAAPRGRAG